MEFDPYYFIKHIPPLDETQRNRQAVLVCKIHIFTVVDQYKWFNSKLILYLALQDEAESRVHTCIRSWWNFSTLQEKIWKYSLMPIQWNIQCICLQKFQILKKSFTYLRFWVQLSNYISRCQIWSLRKNSSLFQRISSTNGFNLRNYHFHCF